MSNIYNTLIYLRINNVYNVIKMIIIIIIKKHKNLRDECTITINNILTGQFFFFFFSEHAIRLISKI